MANGPCPRDYRRIPCVDETRNPILRISAIFKKSGVGLLIVKNFCLTITDVVRGCTGSRSDLWEVADAVG